MRLRNNQAIVGTPGRTTTILGTYNPDMRSVFRQLDPPATLNLGARPGGFNILNAPQDLFGALGDDVFWERYNAVWLQQAIDRGDRIILNSPVTPERLLRENGQPSFFGREIRLLDDAGFSVDVGTGVGEVAR